MFLINSAASFRCPALAMVMMLHRQHNTIIFRHGQEVVLPSAHKFSMTTYRKNSYKCDYVWVHSLAFHPKKNLETLFPTSMFYQTYNHQSMK
jgi:hypothetical protein